MNPTLFQAQIRAWLIGLLWFCPFAILIQLSDSYGLVVLLSFPVLIAFLTAVVTGPFDLLAIITCLVPAAYDVLSDVHQQMAYPVHGTALRPIPLLDVTVCLIAAAIGIGLKRFCFPDSLKSLSQQRRSRFYLWFGADIGLLILIPSILLTIDYIKISHQPTPGQLAQAQLQTLISPTSPDQEKIQAMLELGRVHTPEMTKAVVSALQQAFASPSPDVKFAAAVCLLSRGDASGLSLLEDRLMHSADVTLQAPQPKMQTDWLGESRGMSAMSFNLGMALAQVRDPKAVPILNHLLTSDAVDVRRGAASALRELADPRAIDGLLAALNDPDFDVRYLAVGALMTSTGDPHYPSRNHYLYDEASYINPWKAWAKDRSQSPPRSKPF